MNTAIGLSRAFVIPSSRELRRNEKETKRNVTESAPRVSTMRQTEVADASEQSTGALAITAGVEPVLSTSLASVIRASKRRLSRPVGNVYTIVFSSGSRELYVPADETGIKYERAVFLRSGRKGKTLSEIWKLEIPRAEECPSHTLIDKLKKDNAKRNHQFEECSAMCPSLSRT